MTKQKHETWRAIVSHGDYESLGLLKFPTLKEAAQFAAEYNSTPDFSESYMTIVEDNA